MKRFWLTCSLALVIVAPLSGQAPDSGAFVVRLGADTLVLERYVHTGNRIVAEAVIRSPAFAMRRWDLRLNNAGGIQRMETMDIAVPANTVTRRELLVVVGDTAVNIIQQGDSVRETRTAVARNSLPFLNLVQWPNHFLLASLGPNVGDSIIFPYLTGGNVTRFPIKRVTRDSVTLRHPLRGLTRIHVDERGRLMHLDASATTLKLAVERVNWLPLETLAPQIAARDASRPRADLSPRGETKVAVDGANIVVDYGRPMKRGRAIFGNVVPFGQLWRTGANTATQFKTDRDLVIAGKTLPAGQYSIFSIPQAKEWTIIINSETNQAGTAHKAERDFMRVQAKTSKLKDVVEQFTIAVTDEKKGGTIRFQWDDTEATVPFTVK